MMKDDPNDVAIDAGDLALLLAEAVKEREAAQSDARFWRAAAWLMALAALAAILAW